MTSNFLNFPILWGASRLKKRLLCGWPGGFREWLAHEWVRVNGEPFIRRSVFPPERSHAEKAFFLACVAGFVSGSRLYE